MCYLGPEGRGGDYRWKVAWRSALRVALHPSRRASWVRMRVSSIAVEQHSAFPGMKRPKEAGISPKEDLSFRTYCRLIGKVRARDGF